MSKLLTFVILLLSGTPLAWARPEIKVLALEPAPTPMEVLDPLLVPPSMRAQIPVDAVGLRTLQERVQADRTAMAEAKNKGFYARRIALGLGLVAAYWQMKTTETGAPAPEREAARRELLNFTPGAIKLLPEGEEREELLLLVGVTQFQKQSPSAIQVLRKLKPRNGGDRDLVQFLISLQDLKTGALKQTSKMEELAARVGKRASLVASLEKAAWLAKRGEIYRPELLFVSRLCQDLKPQEAELVFRRTIGIWTKAPDFKGAWEPVPFQISCYQNSPSFAAFLERLAIHARSKGQMDKAIAYYRDAIKGASHNSQKADLSVKFAETHREVYLQSGKQAAYQAALILVEKNFHGQPQGIRALQLHDELIQREMERLVARVPGAAPLADVRKSLDLYLANASFSPSARKVRTRWIDILEANKLYDEAIEGLISLGRGSGGIVREAHMQRALRFQTQLLAYNLANPWEVPGAMDLRQEARLAQILDLLLPSSQKKIEVQIARALLAGRLGQKDEARSRFKQALSQAPERSHQNRIYTTLVLSALSNQDGRELESLCELGLQRTYTLTEKLPDHENLVALYRATLRLNMQDAYVHTRWAETRSKADKLLPLLAEPDQQNDVLYLKSRSFQNEARFADALGLLDQIGSGSVRTGIWQQAMLDKAALLVGQAQLAPAALAYESFLKLAPESDSRIAVQKSLASLTMALGDLGRARFHLIGILTNGSLEETDRILWGQKLIQVHASVQQADALNADIEKIRALNMENKTLLAQLLNLRLRRDPTQNQIESFFQAEDRVIPAVADVLSEAAYQRARQSGAEIFAKAQASLKQADGEGAIQLRANYDRVAGSFLKACEIPKASSCPAALAELLFEAKRYLDWLGTFKLEADAMQIAKRQFEADIQSLNTQVADAVVRGGGRADWLQAYSHQDPKLWRFLGLGAQRGVSTLDLPAALSKDASLQYSQGVSP